MLPTEPSLMYHGVSNDVSHQACRAQIGSISVTHTMAPRAFSAEQHPFPTCIRRQRGFLVSKVTYSYSS